MQQSRITQTTSPEALKKLRSKMKLRRAQKKITQKNAKLRRKLFQTTLKDLGLKKVKGALGGTYYE